MHVIADLERLADLREERRIREAGLTARINALEEDRALMTVDITAAIMALEKERELLVSDIDQAAADLEPGIKEAVVIMGQSVKTSRLHAVFTAGRVSWDGKRLDGYSAAHPEVLAFRSVGQPSVSIREIKAPVEQPALGV